MTAHSNQSMKPNPPLAPWNPENVASFACLLILGGFQIREGMDQFNAWGPLTVAGAYFICWSAFELWRTRVGYRRWVEAGRAALKWQEHEVRERMRLSAVSFWGLVGISTMLVLGLFTGMDDSNDRARHLLILILLVTMAACQRIKLRRARDWLAQQLPVPEE